MLRAAAKAIEGQRGALAETSVADDYARRATYLQRYGPGGATDLSKTPPTTSRSWPTQWAPAVHRCLRTMLAGRRFSSPSIGIPAEDLAENLRCMQSRSNSSCRLSSPKLPRRTSMRGCNNCRSFPSNCRRYGTRCPPGAVGELLSGGAAPRGPADRQPFSSRRCSARARR